MSKFKKGDRVRLEDGREGVVISLYSSAVSELDGATCLRIGHKLETWHEDGLTKIEEQKFKAKDEVLISATIVSDTVGDTKNRFLVVFRGYEKHDDHLYVDQRNFFKKEDLTND